MSGSVSIYISFSLQVCRFKYLELPGSQNALLLHWAQDSFSGCLRGLVVSCWTADRYHPCSNFVVGISEGCFIFDFASLPLEVARPI